MKNKLDKLIAKRNELKKTEKGKAIIKLIRYLVFIFILIIALIISGTGKNNDMASKNVKKESYESKVDVTYKEKQEKLYTLSYDYKYDIIGATNVKYIGTFNNDVVEGYKEDETGVVKYTIIDGISYINQNGENIVYEKLYENLDASLFNFENIFSILNSNKAKIIDKEKEKEYYYENINSYNYSIIMDDEHINKIVIKNDSLEYNFSFNYK